MTKGWIYFGTDSKDYIKLHFLALSHTCADMFIVFFYVSTEEALSNVLINRTSKIDFSSIKNFKVPLKVGYYPHIRTVIGHMIVKSNHSQHAACVILNSVMIIQNRLLLTNVQEHTLHFS